MALVFPFVFSVLRNVVFFFLTSETSPDPISPLCCLSQVSRAVLKNVVNHNLYWLYAGIGGMGA